MLSIDNQALVPWGGISPYGGPPQESGELPSRRQEDQGSMMSPFQDYGAGKSGVLYDMEEDAPSEIYTADRRLSSRKEADLGVFIDMYV